MVPTSGAPSGAETRKLAGPLAAARSPPNRRRAGRRACRARRCSLRDRRRPPGRRRPKQSFRKAARSRHGRSGDRRGAGRRRPPGRRTAPHRLLRSCRHCRAVRRTRSTGLTARRRSSVRRATSCGTRRPPRAPPRPPRRWRSGARFGQKREGSEPQQRLSRTTDCLTGEFRPKDAGSKSPSPCLTARTSRPSPLIPPGGSFMAP